MHMRLRLPELLTEHNPPLTAYAVWKRAGKNPKGKDRISLTTIYRLCSNKGKVANFDGELLEALCDVFGVGPGALLEREGTRGKARKRRRVR